MSAVGGSGEKASPAAGGVVAIPKWAKHLSKALADQAQSVSDKWHGKPFNIPNDILQNQRKEVSEYFIICNAVQKGLLSLSALFEVISQQSPVVEDTHKTILLAEFAASPELELMSQKNADTWCLINQHYEAANGKILQLQFEVKNRLGTIGQTQKSLESRDRKYRKLKEEEAKLQKIRNGTKPEPHYLEKATEKVQKAQSDYDTTTEAVADQVNLILAGRQRFLQDTSRQQLEIQSEFLTKVSTALADIVSSTSRSRTVGGNPSSSDVRSESHGIRPNGNSMLKSLASAPLSASYVNAGQQNVSSLPPTSSYMASQRAFSTKHLDDAHHPAVSEAVLPGGSGGRRQSEESVEDALHKLSSEGSRESHHFGHSSSFDNDPHGLLNLI